MVPKPSKHRAALLRPHPAVHERPGREPRDGCLVNEGDCRTTSSKLSRGYRGGRRQLIRDLRRAHPRKVVGHVVRRGCF